MDLTLTEALQDSIIEAGPGPWGFAMFDPNMVIIDDAPHPELAGLWDYVQGLVGKTAGYRPTLEDVRKLQLFRPDLFKPECFAVDLTYRMRKSIAQMWEAVASLEHAVHGSSGVAGFDPTKYRS